MAGTDSSPKRRNALITISVAVLAGIAAVAWWLTRPEAATVDIDDALGAATSTPTGTDGSATDPPASEPVTAAPTDDQDEPNDAAAGGTWAVSTDAVAYDFASAEGTFVGFRIDEELSSVGATTAVARTPEITGQVTLDDTTVTAAEFTADMTAITSDRSQRQRAINGALEVATTPGATFTLLEPAVLDAVPPVGEAVETTVTGDLTIAGETNTVEIPLQAGLTAEDLLVVTGSFEVALADYDIDKPTARSVVSVADVATVEVQLYLAPDA